MIPKTIHYCWFGKKPLPDGAKKCIASWRRFFPEYEIIEWNEDNYDVNKIPYTEEAYKSGKYAFVSDYARFDILYQYGGVYFDTDVEVIKPFTDILSAGGFMGCEIDGTKHVDTPTDSEEVSFIAVNSGQGIAAEKGCGIYREILSYYEKLHFFQQDNRLNTETVVRHVTRVLEENGLKNICGIQKVGDIVIYPKEFFNPLNNNTGKLTVTENTRSIHWYSMSWLSKKERTKSRITRVFHRIFGEDCFKWLKKGGSV